MPEIVELTPERTARLETDCVPGLGAVWNPELGEDCPLELEIGTGEATGLDGAKSESVDTSVEPVELETIEVVGRIELDRGPALGRICPEIVEPVDTRDESEVGARTILELGVSEAWLSPAVKPTTLALDVPIELWVETVPLRRPLGNGIGRLSIAGLEELGADALAVLKLEDPGKEFVELDGDTKEEVEKLTRARLEDVAPERPELLVKIPVEKTSDTETTDSVLPDDWRLGGGTDIGVLKGFGAVITAEVEGAETMLEISEDVDGIEEMAELPSSLVLTVVSATEPVVETAVSKPLGTLERRVLTIVCPLKPIVVTTCGSELAAPTDRVAETEVDDPEEERRLD